MIWGDKAVSQAFFQGLIGRDVSREIGRIRALPAKTVADWVMGFGLGALTAHQYRAVWPELAAELLGEQFSVTAENAMQFASLQKVLEKLTASDVRPLIFKGALLAQTIYPDSAARPMTDADLWVEESEVERTAELIQQLGYERKKRSDRPMQLQKLAHGEIELFHPTWQRGAIDLHYSPFHGWWFRWATTMDRDEVWGRKQPARILDADVWQLSAEDTIVQLALHLAINEQFAPHASLRALIDMALVIEQHDIDWHQVVENTRRWQVSVAVWSVLNLLDYFIGLDAIKFVLSELEPSWLKQKLIAKITSPQLILDQRNVQFTRARFLLMLTLTENVSRTANYVRCAVWPDKEWLTARYGHPVTHFHHFGRILKNGTD